jgi:hypothetical protein
MIALAGHPLTRWPAAGLPQALPLTTGPVPDETLESYLRRLALANGLNYHSFLAYVKGSSKSKAPVPADRVIALSGQPARSMRYAILELCTPQQLTAMNVAGRPRPGSSIRGDKCARCTAARCIYGPVKCWKLPEDVICLPHRRWTTGLSQLDLTGHDDVIRAGMQHRKLIRQLGRTAVSSALAQSSAILSEWTERNRYRTRVDQRMKRFHGRQWKVDRENPTLLASYYIPAVALTRLLASPGWKALALSPAGNAEFVAGVRRTVEPRYAWDPRPSSRYVEPLARALLQERGHDVAASASGKFPACHPRQATP